MSDLKQHPLSAAFPAMEQDDLARLAIDIQDNGLIEPGVLFEGMILDGWHRYQACLYGEVEFVATEYAGSDPVKFVTSRNFHRRHMTASQRAVAIVACNEWKPVGANQHAEVGSETVSTPQKSNAELAKEAQTTVRTVTDAKAAVKAGLGKAVRDGDMSAHTAAAVATGKAPKKNSPPKAKVEPVVIGNTPTLAAMQAQDAENIEQAAVERAELEAEIKAVYADDKLAHLMAENKRLAGVVVILESQIKGAQNREGELIRKVKRLERELAKAGKKPE